MNALKTKQVLQNRYALIYVKLYSYSHFYLLFLIYFRKRNFPVSLGSNRIIEESGEMSIKFQVEVKHLHPLSNNV